MSDPVITINTINPEAFGAKLLDYSVGPCRLTDSYIQPPKSYFPTVLRGTVGLRPISLTFDFEGDDIADAANNVSDFTSQLLSGASFDLPDGFSYFCALDNVSGDVRVAPWIIQKTFMFIGARTGAVQTHTLTSTGSIEVEGNCNTLAVLSITTLATTITVMGITLTKPAGAATILIDSLAKTVTIGGENIFSDTDLTAFPVLTPGNNSIEIAGTATVVLSYIPVYL